MKLSNLSHTLDGSAIRLMFNEALKMTDTIKFTVGEPDFVTPRPIIDAACGYWRQGLTHYTPNRGVAALREAISEYHGADLAPDPESQIIVTCGATEAIQLALFATVDPGDEVIVIGPAWSNYFGQIGMCGARAVVVPAREENDFIPDPGEIERAVTPKTKAIILNSPCNPTGAVIGAEVNRALAGILVRHDLFILSDEVYSRLIYDGLTHSSITEHRELLDRIIYINSFSKMFAMTGWRLGYAIGAPEVIRSMTKLHENGASCLPEPSQLAAVEALRGCTGEIERMRQIYEKRRNLMCEGINRIPGISCRLPKGAFYVLANIKETGVPSKEFCMDLLKKTGVVTVPGSGFGAAGEGYVRFTYATSEENILEGMARIGRYMEKR